MKLALAMIADEERAEPGEAVDHGDGRKPDAGNAAEQHRLQRDVVQDVRPDPAQEPAQLRHAGKAVRRRQAAALPGQRMRDEALGLDRLLALVQPCRDMNFVAGRLRRARHGQAVRQEVPVLGDDIEDASSHGRVLPVAVHNASIVLNKDLYRRDGASRDRLHVRGMPDSSWGFTGPEDAPVGSISC